MVVVTRALLVHSPAFGQTIRDGRNVGLAGSGALGMYGAQAVGWNPANLGLKANPHMTITFLSAGVSLGNNAFSPDYIGTTFVEGDTLDSLDIEDILSEIKSDRVTLYSGLSAPLFGISSGNYALNVLDFHLVASGAIPQEVFELLLRGWERDRVYSFDAVEEDVMIYWTTSFSVAKPLTPPTFMKELAVGATFKYIHGTFYEGLGRSGGSFQVTQEAIITDGEFQHLQSTSGDGVGLDLGASGWLNEFDVQVGLTIGNLIGSISWTDVEVEELTFELDEGIYIDRLLRKNYWKHLFNDTTVSYTMGSLRKPLPRYLLLSACKPGLPWIRGGDLFFSWYQGLNDAPGHSTTPRLSLGAELRPRSWFPLRVGIAVGGIEGSEFSGGFGLDYSIYQLNFGASWQRGLFFGAKGFSFAITNCIRL